MGHDTSCEPDFGVRSHVPRSWSQPKSASQTLHPQRPRWPGAHPEKFSASSTCQGCYCSILWRSYPAPGT